MRYGPWPRRGRLLRHFSFSSSFLRCPNPGGQGHVQGALAHRAQRGLPWTWPRRDYIAHPEEEEKAPQQSAAACGCQGPATAMVPAVTAGGEGKEHAPATGARQHTARPVKDHLTYSGAQRPARGGGARCPHTERQPTPAPHPARACAAWPRYAQGLRPWSASTAPGPPHGPCWRPDRGGRPAGAQRGRALTQESCGTTLRSLARREESRRGAAAGRATPRTVVDDVPCWGKPRAARRAAPGTGRSGTAASIQER